MQASRLHTCQYAPVCTVSLELDSKPSAPRLLRTRSHIREDILHEIVRACGAEAFFRHLCWAFRDGEVAREGFPEGDMSFRVFGVYKHGEVDPARNAQDRRKRLTARSAAALRHAMGQCSTLHKLYKR